jgi:hypothetical protein
MALRDRPQIPPETWDTALHESRHAAVGAAAGLEIHEIVVDGDTGHTIVSLPFHDYQLSTKWAADPARTTARMVCTIAMIVAPVAAEGALFPHKCGDSDRLGEYARWWKRLRPTSATALTPPDWMVLLHTARAAVQRWATGSMMAQYTLAVRLARAGTVDAEGWRWLWNQDFTKPLRHFQAATVPLVRPAARPAALAASQPKSSGASTPSTRRQQPAVAMPWDPGMDWRTGGRFPFTRGIYAA